MLPPSSTGRSARANPVAIVALVLLLLLISAVVINRARPRPGPAAPPAPTAPIAPDGAAAEVTEDDIRLNNRGVGLMGRYEYAPARAVFEELVTRHPEWLDVRVNLAIATLNRQEPGDEEAGLAIVRAVLREDPSQVRAHYVAGILSLYMDEIDSALDHLRFVAERRPADAHTAYYIAFSKVRLGEAEQALEWYDRAIENDPYLRSAYFGKSRALRMLGREDEADEMFDLFQRLAPNPRAHLAEFIYGRMGPKAKAAAVGEPRSIEAFPEGPIFEEAVAMLGEDARSLVWNLPLGRPVSMTVADITGNGELDVFAADVLREVNGAMNAVILREDGLSRLQLSHPLALVSDVNAVLWGDIDNNGLVDVYFCRRGPNQLWKQTAPGQWEDVTAAMGVSGGRFDTVNGLMFDADHDGDLDIFIVNADGPNELFSNNMDGTFRRLGASQGIGGDGRPSRKVIAADLESDRDLDLIIINREPPHEVYLNDRLWQYRPAGEGSPFERFVGADILAAVAGDARADGRVELFTVNPAGTLQRWEPDAEGTYAPMVIADDLAVDEATQIALVDVTGDASHELIVTSRGMWIVVRLDDGEIIHSGGGEAPVAGWAQANLERGMGPSIIGMPSRGLTGPLEWAPGPGRHPFASIEFTGLHDPGHALRSNASGIGTRYAARIGTHWVTGSTLPSHSGPGQSLQPDAIGLAGHQQIDFIAIDWSDGVFQSEIDLAMGEVHTITETQRQLASCPVVFVWDGERYEFASDVLGVGGIGFAVGPGEYAEPRPWERYMFKEGLLQPRSGTAALRAGSLGDATSDRGPHGSESRGTYVIKIGEPMEEALYLDTAALIAYDLPPGWSMTIDERMGISAPYPTGESIFYRHSMLPVRAVNDRGEDVTEILREQDYRAAPPGELDLRFIGRLAGEHVLTLEFENAIGHMDEGWASPASTDAEQSQTDSAQPYFVADGWIEYPYSQTAFAAWQAGADYRAPTLEARDPNTGEWVIVWEQFGYPAGFPRQMAMPLPMDTMPPGAREVRIRTNQEIYWDRIKIIYAEQPPAELVRHELEMVRAEVKRTGFAQRVLLDQRRAYYDYNKRLPLWDTRHQAGFYTEFGCVLDLIRDRNDALAIIGPGEEIHMEFAPRKLPSADQGSEEDPDRGPEVGGQRSEVGNRRSEVGDYAPPRLPDGWSRRFVIDLHGWCKDMDLYTKDGETLEPIPSAGIDPSPREELHERFNTRYRSGF